MTLVSVSRKLSMNVSARKYPVSKNRTLNIFTGEDLGLSGGQPLEGGEPIQAFKEEEVYSKKPFHFLLQRLGHGTTSFPAPIIYLHAQFPKSSSAQSAQMIFLYLSSCAPGRHGYLWWWVSGESKLLIFLGPFSHQFMI